MKTDYIIVRFYNTGYADVVTEQGTLYTDKAQGESWVRLARMKGYREMWKRYDNGDQTYWFN